MTGRRIVAIGPVALAISANLSVLESVQVERHSSVAVHLRLSGVFQSLPGVRSARDGANAGKDLNVTATPATPRRKFDFALHPALTAAILPAHPFR